MKKWGMVTTVAIASVLAGGCSVGREFRTVAGPAVELGVSSIMNGLLDAVFAVIEPDPEPTG